MNGIRKLMMALCIAVVILCSASTTCLAETSYWKLRYVKNGPMSLQIYEWDTTVTATKDTTELSATNITNGAEIYVHTSNGITSLYKTATATSVKTKKGTSIYAFVKYTKYGSSTNYPAGRLVY